MLHRTRYLSLALAALAASGCNVAGLFGTGAPRAAERTMSFDSWANVSIAVNGRTFRVRAADLKPIPDLVIQAGPESYSMREGKFSMPEGALRYLRDNSRAFFRVYVAGYVPEQIWIAQAEDEIVLAPQRTRAVTLAMPPGGGRLADGSGDLSLDIPPGMLTQPDTRVALGTYRPNVDQADVQAHTSQRDALLAKVKARAGKAYALAQSSPTAACEAPEAPLPCPPASEAFGVLVTVDGPLQPGRMGITLDLDKLLRGWDGRSTPPWTGNSMAWTDEQIGQALAAARILQTYDQIAKHPDGPLYEAALQESEGLQLKGRVLSFGVDVGAGQTVEGIVRTDIKAAQLLGVKLEFTAVSSTSGRLPSAAKPRELSAPSVADRLIPGVSANSLIGLDRTSLLSRGAGSLVGLDSATLIGLDGGSLIGLDGGSLVGLDGGSLVGLDGGSLIGLDGGSLIGLDGGTLIGMDGGSLVGLDSSSLIGLDGGSLLGMDLAALTKGRASGLVGLDGGSLIGLDGGSLVGLDGGSLVPNPGGALAGFVGLPGDAMPAQSGAAGGPNTAKYRLQSFPEEILATSGRVRAVNLNLDPSDPAYALSEWVPLRSDGMFAIHKLPFTPQVFMLEAEVGSTPYRLRGLALAPLSGLCVVKLGAASTIAATRYSLELRAAGAAKLGSFLFAQYLDDVKRAFTGTDLAQAQAAIATTEASVVAHATAIGIPNGPVFSGAIAATPTPAPVVGSALIDGQVVVEVVATGLPKPYGLALKQNDKSLYIGEQESMIITEFKSDKSKTGKTWGPGGLSKPTAIFDPSGNNLQVLDFSNKALLSIKNSTVTTLASFADGPWDMVAAGPNRFYVSLPDTNTIVRLDDPSNAFAAAAFRLLAMPGELAVSPFVDGTGVFNKPRGLAYHDETDRLFVADDEHHLIHVVLADGTIKPFPLAGSLKNPWALALSPKQDFLYVAEHENARVSRIDVKTGAVVTLASNFGKPCSLVVADDGDLYVGDDADKTVYRIRPEPDPGKANGKAKP